MEKTLKAIQILEKEGAIKNYAIGGAMAVMFYTEPSLTFDLDIFIFLPSSDQRKQFVTLSPLYENLKKKGCQVEKEHIIIEGIPVQFIPVYNELVEKAVIEAREFTYQNIKTRVIGAEYLLAIMMDTGRAKDRERIAQFLGTVTVDQKKLMKILKQHHLKQKWEKTIGKIKK